MTKEDLQKELKAKLQAGVKPSQIRKRVASTPTLPVSKEKAKTKSLQTQLDEINENHQDYSKDIEILRTLVNDLNKELTKIFLENGKIKIKNPRNQS